MAVKPSTEQCRQRGLVTELPAPGCCWGTAAGGGFVEVQGRGISGHTLS